MGTPFNTNEYKAVQDNRFLSVATSPLSTFAADVDTASYAQLRRLILAGRHVLPDSVRTEEMLNYFPYAYPQPEGDAPFRPDVTVFQTPWMVSGDWSAPTSRLTTTSSIWSAGIIPVALLR